MEVSLKKIRWSTIAYGLMALLLLFLVVSLVVVYFVPRTVPSVEKIAERSPYPAVILGYRSMISFRELAQNTQSVRHFYEAQDFSKIGLRVDFSTDDGRKRLKVREKEVLNKMVEDEAIILLSKKRGIFVSADTVRQSVARKIEEYGDQQEVQEKLNRLYDWELADFEEKVVLPSLYQDKLEESFLKETDPALPAKTKIEKAAEALRQGSDFAAVVKEYSEGATGDEGGDLGWFALTDLAPELRSPVASQKAGVPGSIIESSLGFHIILVEETKEGEHGELYHIGQVFTRKYTFGDWLTDQMKTLSILVLDPDYQWDEDAARVEFRSADWRRYEEELLQKGSGDASFFF